LISLIVIGGQNIDYQKNNF